MPSTVLFLAGTVLLSLNLVRFAGLAISDWLFFGAIVLALVETIRSDRSSLHCWLANRFIWLAGLILLGAILSTTQTLFLEAAVMEIFQQLYVVTLFISLTWIMIRRGKLDAIVQALIWSGVLAAGVVALDYYFGTNLGGALSGIPDMQFWGRYAGPLGHPNKLGYYLVITVLLSIARLTEMTSRRSGWTASILWFLLIALQMLGIYLSGSLTAYVGLLFGMLALLLSSALLRKQVVYLLLPVIFLGLPLVLLGISFEDHLPTKNLIPKTSMIASAFERVETQTASSRWSIFEEAAEIISDSPWLGAGYDQIATSNIDMEYRQLDGTIHNIFLQSFYVGGLLVFAGWLAIYVILGLEAITVLRLGPKGVLSPLILGIAAAALAIILMDQFQDSVYQREKWLVFGLLAGCAWTIKLPIIRRSPGHSLGSESRMIQGTPQSK